MRLRFSVVHLLLLCCIPSVAHAATGWLSTDGNRILDATGHAWMGRGANIQDTRSCWACETPHVDEVKRRLNALIDDWKANVVRLTMESHDGFGNVLADPNYMADTIQLVRHIGSKPGVYVMLALWHDPSLNPNDGFPSPQGIPIWKALTRAFKNDPQVIFSLCNEPKGHTGERNAEVWQRMNQTAEAIRREETAMGTPHHLIAVQGTYDWARHLEYYLDHPITAGGGKNIVYETHPYNTAAEFESLLLPAKKLPVIIGEFGPHEKMPGSNPEKLINYAEAHHLPWLAWTFHQQCPPNLIQATGTTRCGVGMFIKPTQGWGELVYRRLLAKGAKANQ